MITLPTATLLAGKANLWGTEARTKWKFPVQWDYSAQASASNIKELRREGRVTRHYAGGFCIFKAGFNLGAV